MKLKHILPLALLAALPLYAGAQQVSLVIEPFSGGAGYDGKTITLLLENNEEIQKTFFLLQSGEGADYRVEGDIQRPGERFRVRFFIVDTKTSRRLSLGFCEYRDIIEVAAYIPEIAQKIVRLGGGEVSPAQTPEAGTRDLWQAEEEAQRAEEKQGAAPQQAEEPEEQTPPPEEPAYYEKVHLGLRSGASLRFYDMAEIERENANSFVYEGAAYLTWNFSRRFALQAEVVYSEDTVSYEGSGFMQYGSSYYYGEYSAEFWSHSLMFPLLLKLTFRPGSAVISFFGGVYYTLPVSQMNYENSASSGQQFNYSVPLGRVVGANVGIQLGPGNLCADVRYAADMGNTSISGDPGNLELYSRSMVSFSLGYEIGF
jgi:hypothetical protein